LVVIKTTAPRVDAERLDGAELLKTAGLEIVWMFGHGCTAFYA
jgi:hypothetical protein